MKRVMIALTVLLVFTVSAFAQRTAGQGGDMMGGGWGLGMNSG
jgi:Spy/CpxP family protein refolding chaperone